MSACLCLLVKPARRHDCLTPNNHGGFGSNGGLVEDPKQEERFLQAGALSCHKDVFMHSSIAGMLVAHKVFESRGYTVRQVSPLSIGFVSQDSLIDCLSRPTDYSGIVITSQMAVEAIERACEDSGVLDAWRHGSDKVILTIGTATADRAESVGLDTRVPWTAGSASGACVARSAGHLAELVIAHREQLDLRRPLLFLCGDK